MLGHGSHAFSGGEHGLAGSQCQALVMLSSDAAAHSVDVRGELGFPDAVRLLQEAKPPVSSLAMLG